MPETNPPFLNAYGNVTKVLERIREAKTPPRFTQDFLATVLRCPSASARPVIPLLKRLGFLSADGVPTERYKKFRNSAHAGAVMAAGIRDAYDDLFRRNEYAHDLKRDELKNLVVESTGLEPTSSVVKGVVGTFESLNKFADWENETEPEADSSEVAAVNEDAVAVSAGVPSQGVVGHNAGIGVAFQINLVLPDTDNPAVFQAIFRSLREHLLP